ncbi:MAG TPA: ABC transporter permease [Firmicutes bacterium]|nr:ABC transporter permease [Bacillota bacterium]
MRKFFYPKLAASNIKKNGRTYIPYILTCIFMVAMYYIISSLARNPGIKDLLGGDTVEYTLVLGGWVVAIFAAIFLFYTNSFLMKRRKKEFGLLNILGMEKKHLSRVIGYETLYIAGISLAFGILLGIVLDKCMFLLILKVLDAPVSLGFYVSFESMLLAGILFAAIFLLIFLNSLRQIRLSSPIELLRGSSVGEKEPKTKWIMAILGVLCLSGGYYLAVTTQNPLTAVSLFFLAVLLVVAGTYFLFMAGSIAFLKLLRKKKSYYYKAKHFISVSGLIYRMKQNAVGLANICILSTMVLVMVASTSSMMLGMEDIINTRYPYDITVYARAETQAQREAVDAAANRLLEAYGAQKTAAQAYTYLNFSAVREGDTFLVGGEEDLTALERLNNLFFIPVEDYNRLTGDNAQLAEGEILLYSNRDAYEPDTLTVFDRTYRIVGRPDNFLGNGVMEADIVSSRFIVVRDVEEIVELNDLQRQAYGKNASEFRYFYGFDLDIPEEQQRAFYAELKDSLNSQDLLGIADSRADSRQSFHSLYGGLFFIGIFLGLLFIVATILIIYYKQISEGYDDRERYVIMQKVGMSQAEVKRSIHSQILTVFFLPLITAGVHTAFAFPVISKILALLSMSNTTLFALCTVGCFLVFALLYSLIYALTARAYYRIVSR